MEHVITPKFHKNNLSDPDEKYKRKCVELSHQICKSKKIYLDTKYWILLRDARTNKNVNDNTVKLLRLIESLVGSGHAICPISTDVFWEIQKQMDDNTLISTAKIIDDLSKGIIISCLPERQDWELIHYFRTTSKHPAYLHEKYDELVWTKIPYVLKFCLPVINDIHQDENRKFQNVSMDYMWDIKLTDMLKKTGQNIIIPPPYYIDHSDTLNQIKYEHISDQKSFKKLFLIELAQIFNSHKRHSKGLVASFYNSPSIINIICHVFELNKITTELPSFHVWAKLHAAFRWDKSRQFKPNDIYDIHHAVNAIPYYDYFLTEKSFRSLVSQKNMGFDTIFRCKAISDINISISELSKILSVKNGE